MEIIKEELLEVKDKYGDIRRSEINFAGGDLSIEDMIPDEQVVITISHAGYIKRTPLTEYKIQHRGGVGQKASATRTEDFLEHLFVGTNHQYMLFFTQKGKCFWMRVYEIPEGIRVSTTKSNKIIIFGTNLEQLSSFAARIRKLRTPDNYKGKGIRYVNEVIYLKEGKKKK